MSDSLMDTLAALGAVEANLAKLESLWSEISSLMPKGFDFSDNPAYEDKCFAFEAVLAALPRIGGWKPQIELFESAEIAQMNFDCSEIGEAEAYISLTKQLEAPGKKLREYRFKFNRRRADLLKVALDEHLSLVDQKLLELSALIPFDADGAKKIDLPEWQQLVGRITEIEALLGSTTRPARWNDLRRHLGFGMIQDLQDIIKTDWPAIRPALARALYGENDPINVGISDLDEIANPGPTSPIITALAWDSIDAEKFERLLFRLISSEEGYENPLWLTKTNAADRGRDLSVYRVSVDGLAGTTRRRVIIQCKHWLTKSVAIPEVAALKEQMKLWEPPLVEVVVIATSGRFSSDAIQSIERHNQSDSALRIEMWPESHLELLLAARPAIVAEFFPNRLEKANS